MNFEQTVIYYLSTYEFPAIFIGSFFLGETVVFISSFLSGQGIWSPYYVLIFAFFGTIAADTLWYLAAWYLMRTHKDSKRVEKFKNKHQDLIKKLESLTGTKPFLALLFIKFMYGTRILLIFYITFRKIGFWKFTLFNCIGTLIWLGIIITIGWLAGRGIANFAPTYHKFGYFLLAFVLIIILFHIFAAKFQKYLIKKK